MKWQTIRESGAEWVRTSGRGNPIRLLIGGVVVFLLLIVLLIPLVILGAIVLVVSLLRRLAQALVGSAAGVLPRDDGRRNVKVRTPEQRP